MYMMSVPPVESQKSDLGDTRTERISGKQKGRNSDLGETCLGRLTGNQPGLIE